MNHDLHTGRPERRPVGTIAFPGGTDFAPEMTPAQVGAYSTLALAHIGDGVYELMMRTVRRVNAPAQARAAEAILPLLTEAEHAVYKRGRNAKVNSVPQHADVAQYHAATGLETLFGWLYLLGRTQRLRELFAVITEVL